MKLVICPKGNELTLKVFVLTERKLSRRWFRLESERPVRGL